MTLVQLKTLYDIVSSHKHHNTSSSHKQLFSLSTMSYSVRQRGNSYQLMCLSRGIILVDIIFMRMDHKSFGVVPIKKSNEYVLNACFSIQNDLGHTMNINNRHHMRLLIVSLRFRQRHSQESVRNNKAI